MRVKLDFVVEVKEGTPVPFDAAHVGVEALVSAAQALVPHGAVAICHPIKIHTGIDARRRKAPRGVVQPLSAAAIAEDLPDRARKAGAA